MSMFLDGPAHGTKLRLASAPFLLRIAIERGTGAVDALDQIDDAPRDTEDVHVYRRDTDPVLVCDRTNGSLGPCQMVADYLYVHTDAEQLRQKTAWDAWVKEQPGDIVAASRIRYEPGQLLAEAV